MTSGKRKTTRIAAALSALLVVLCSLPVVLSPAFADEYHAAFTKPSLEVDSEALYKRSETLDSFTDVSQWVGSDGVKSVERSTYTGGAQCVLAKADGESVRSLSISREFEGENGFGISSAGYAELSFSVVFGGDGSDYTLTATVGTGAGTHVYSCAISPDVGQDVFLDLSVIGGANITSFSLTVESDDTRSAVSYAALSSLVIGDVSHTEIARRFSALYVYGGEITEDGIKVTPKEQTALVRAEAVLPTGSRSEGTTAIISLTLKNVGYSKITMLTSSFPAWRENDYTAMISLTVTSETETYVFCFDSPDKIASWALSFEGVSTSGDDAFYIEDVTLDFGGSSEKADQTAGLGTVTKCAYAGDGNIVVSGTVSHDAVVDYIDGSIGLYLIPAWQSVGEALEKEPAIVSDISTSFSFRISPEDFPTASGCRFAAALIKDGKAALIAQPLWASPPSSFSQDRLPDFIAQSSSTAGTFEFGADAAVIDVDVSKLIRPSNDTNSRLVSWGDSIFFFNQSILSAISADAAFYHAAGIKVYFRIICTTDRFSAAPGISGTYYAANVSTASNGDMICALVNCFSERFAPSGYILGAELNVRRQNTTALFSDAFSLMEQSAKCARAIYSVALRYDPNTIVILPFEAQDASLEADDADDAISPRHSAITCTALADYYISRDPTPIRWASLIAADEDSADDIPSQAATNHGSGFLGTAITSTGGNETFDVLKERFPLALFYAAPLGGEYSGVRTAPEPTVSALPYTPEGYAGKLTLWDFSKSFSADSFVLSNRKSLDTGACPVFTALGGERTSSRALYLDLSRSDGETATVVAAAPIADGVNLENCGALELRLAAFSDSDSARLTIHTGDAKVRLKYPVVVKSGEACSVVCVLPPGVDPTFLALSAEAGDGVSVHLSSVNALSETLTDEELAADAMRGQIEEDDATVPKSERYFLISIAVIAGLTVATFVFLNRRSRIRKMK